MPHRSWVFKTQVSCKKYFTYSGVFKLYSDVLKPYSGVFLQFMEIESLKLDFHMDFSLHQTHPLTNRDLKPWVLDTRDASFQYCFEMWQLTKFFYIYCYLKRVFYISINIMKVDNVTKDKIKHDHSTRLQTIINYNK